MRKILTNILQAIGVFIGIVLLYGLAAVVLPLFEIPGKQTSEPGSVPVYIYTNGVHTDIVVPVINAQKNWSQELPFENTVSKRTDFRYVGIGWGDKGFYLDTPTWADLKFSTAFRAAFWLSESAMHCTYYKEMKEGKDCVKMMLSPSQYRNLVAFIEAKFDRDRSGKPILIPTKAVYGTNDAFYDARGRYSFLETCNTWANNALKAAGQKAALWTATDSGIFRHYRE